MSNFKQLSAPMTPERLADLKQRRHGLSFFWSQQVGELIAAVEEKDKRIAELERIVFYKGAQCRWDTLRAIRQNGWVLAEKELAEFTYLEKYFAEANQS